MYSNNVLFIQPVHAQLIRVNSAGIAHRNSFASKQAVLYKGFNLRHLTKIDSIHHHLIQ